IPDSDDPVERLLATLQWWISKDSKFVKGKLVKPFNSILGEQFFCKWETSFDSSNPKDTDTVSTAPSSSTASVSSFNASSAPTSDSLVYTVEYITEQVSHHPPVSAYVYRCKQKGIQLTGLDHISAKFSGLSMTISPGSWCKGSFLTLESRNNEMYHCYSSDASISGWMRGKLKVLCTGPLRIICPATKLAVIIDFSEKTWYGQIKDVISGAVFHYDPEIHDVQSWTMKTVPSSISIIAKISGQWDGKVFLEYPNSSGPVLFFDMYHSKTSPKIVKPLQDQSEFESRRIWGDVAKLMIEKNHN
ncbi:hypothetical protein BB560_006615, partial [Smittium megazygosporum]